MRCSRRRCLWGLAGLASALTTREAKADIERVERIRARVLPELEASFARVGLRFPASALFLRVFKHERVLEMWAAQTPDEPMVLVESHPICAASGELGPKRRYGDEQVPEGVYTIHRYNGWSGFHMSLRVDYPNASDRRRGNRFALGGAIMVHGDCVSIGCIAIENAPIERVFLAVLAARRASGRNVPIHIFPTRLDDEGQRRLEPLALADADRAALWAELRPIYAFFEAHKQVPEVEIDPRSGAYRLATPADPVRP